MRGYFARPASTAGSCRAWSSIHENRGLNPYIEDVARRLAVANFLAFAPDALAPLGGYPGDEEKAAQMFGQLDRAKRTEDLVAAVRRSEVAPRMHGQGRRGRLLLRRRHGQHVRGAAARSRRGGARSTAASRAPPMPPRSRRR